MGRKGKEEYEKERNRNEFKSRIKDMENFKREWKKNGEFFKRLKINLRRNLNEIRERNLVR